MSAVLPLMAKRIIISRPAQVLVSQRNDLHGIGIAASYPKPEGGLSALEAVTRIYAAQDLVFMLVLARQAANLFWAGDIRSPFWSHGRLHAAIS